MSAKRPTRWRTWTVIALLLAGVAGYAVYARLRPVTVTVAPVVRGRAVEAVYATGTVEPIERVVVKARLSEHVARILVKEGDAVTAGQLLAELDNPVRAFALRQGQAQLGRAQAQAGARSPQLAGLAAQVRGLEAQLDQARLELDRTTRLARTAAVPQAELDAARAKVALLDAQVQAAAEQLRSAKVDLSATRDQLAAQVGSLAAELGEGAVTSPLAGVVLRRDVEPGEVVAQNQAMFEVADTRTLLIELHVDEADIARINDGPTPTAAALSFYAFPGQAFAGTVAEILPEPDRIRRAYTVRVRLDQPIAGLRVGMTAEANLIVSRKDDAVLVPIEALDRGHAWFAVDGRAVRRPVTIGIRGLTDAEVTAGAAAGDQAIVDAVARGVGAGDRIRAVPRARP
ncbi:MAG: efflux RND transporter periplasmic adaptor subunit [Myxococcales bacterium]|nr:efflux RND transporter periplasmic adaptor subunit [Myxococcales bacterium]